MTTKNDAADREIVITQVIDALRERVWEAMTDPAHLDAWWGPTGFRNVTHEIAMKPGGVWKHKMIGPDGMEYPNTTKFEELAKPDHVIFLNGGGNEEKGGTSFRATWSLRDLGGKTELTLRSVFPTREARDHVVKAYNAVE